jgi:hypothetical protein
MSLEDTEKNMLLAGLSCGSMQTFCFFIKQIFERKFKESFPKKCGLTG